MAEGAVHLVTFGGGSRRWRLASARLARQARQSGWFDAVTAFTEKDLPTLVPDLCLRQGEFMRSHPRGFGYWIWRPFLLRALLESLPEGDVVVYLDAGCELNVTRESAARLDSYVADAQERGFLAMRTDFPMAAWTKADLLYATDATSRQHTSALIEPGVMLIPAVSDNVERMSVWGEWCERDDRHFLDDSPSEIPNDPSFIEHRHDQSILTSLEVELGLHAIGRESYFPRAWHTEGCSYPVWATRNRWPIRRESGNPAERVFSRLHSHLTRKE